MVSKITRLITIIIVAILALILINHGIYYVYVLILIGVVVTLITRYKRDAVFTGALYVVLGHLMSIPNGDVPAEFLPTIDIPVHTTISTNIINQLTGMIIPILMSTIITLMVSYIIQKLLSLQKPKKQNRIYTFNNQANGYYDPITKSKKNRRKK